MNMDLTLQLRSRVVGLTLQLRCLRPLLGCGTPSPSFHSQVPKPPPLAEFLWKPFWLHQVDFITSLSTFPLHLLQSSTAVDITIIPLSVSLSNYHLRLSRFSCVLTLCNPMDCSPLGSSAHRILQARILEWVAKPSSRGHSRPLRLNPPLLSLLHLVGRIFTISAIWETLSRHSRSQTFSLH